MHLGMRPGLKSHQEQRDNREHNLQALRSLFSGGAFAPAPLCGGAVAEVVNPGDHREVYNRSQCGHDQHGNTDGILMPAFGWGVDSAGSGQCG